MRTDDVIPGCLATTIARYSLVQIQFFAVQRLCAILAGVLVALEDVVTGKLDFLFWHPVENKKDDDPGYAIFERDGIDHLRLGWSREISRQLSKSCVL